MSKLGAALTQRMSTWSGGRRGWETAAALAPGVALAVTLGTAMGAIFTQADTASYLAMASGHTEQATFPFASRPLEPLLVRALLHLSHMSLERGFVLVGIAALLVFFGTVVALLVRSGAPRWMLAAVVGLSFWTQQWNGLVQPDLLYAALLCAFLLLLRAQRIMPAMLMLFPLAVCRESTLLTLVCLLLAGWRLLRGGEATVAVASTGAGLALANVLATTAQPNVEVVSPTLYLIARMPWNFLKNVAGLSPWANVYRSCAVPQWQMHVHLGPLRALGYCGLDWRAPVEVFGAAMAIFGLLPLLLWKVRGAWPARSKGRSALMLRFCVVYGAISFLAAPLLGETLTRLYGYAWPLFLVALPVLLGASRAGFRSGWAAGLFVLLHLSANWLQQSLRALPLLLAAGAIWLTGGALLATQWGVEPEPEHADAVL